MPERLPVTGAAPAAGRLAWLDSRGGKIAVVVARCIVAGVFLYAAIPKLTDPTAFAEAIDNYHLVPVDFVGPIAAILPVIELITALALLTGIEARGAALITGLMLAAFCVAMIQAIARGIDLDCGCFGAEQRAQVGWDGVARNLALLGACALVALSRDVPWTDLGSPRKPLEKPAEDPSEHRGAS